MAVTEKKARNHLQLSALILRAARDEKTAKAGGVRIALWSGETVAGEPARRHAHVDLLLTGDDEDWLEMLPFFHQLFKGVCFTTDLADPKRSNVITWHLVKGKKPRRQL